MSAAPEPILTECLGSLSDRSAVRWYAVYTHANHEKRVAEQLGLRGVERFLPLYECVSRWKDRHVTLHRPLFPSYVFVRIALCDRLLTLQVPGVARLVGFDGTPSALPEPEVEALRAALRGGVPLHPHPFLTVGRRVWIKRGPLAGTEGILLRRKAKSRVVISVKLIQRSVIVDADESDLDHCLE
jgi:transcription antitermination factor NusG